MSADRPYLGQAIEMMRAEVPDGYAGIPDHVLAGTFQCARIEVALAFRAARAALRESMPRWLRWTVRP